MEFAFARRDVHLTLRAKRIIYEKA